MHDRGLAAILRSRGHGTQPSTAQPVTGWVGYPDHDATHQIFEQVRARIYARQLPVPLLRVQEFEEMYQKWLVWYTNPMSFPEDQMTIVQRGHWYRDRAEEWVEYLDSLRHDESPFPWALVGAGVLLAGVAVLAAKK